MPTTQIDSCNKTTFKRPVFTMTFPQRWGKTLELTSMTMPTRKERLKEKMTLK